MKKRTGLSIAAMTAFGLALPLTGSAAAPNHIEDAAIKVSYADLNIENSAGAKVLYTRLQRASQEVCDIGTHVVVRSLTESRKARNCYEKALAAAVEKVGSAVLSDFHDS